MAKTDNINIRIEPKLKKEVEKTLEELGMNIADAVTVFLKQVVMTESIPFIIRKQTYNNDTLQALKEAEAVMEHPEDYKCYNNIDDLMEDLNDEKD